MDADGRSDPYIKIDVDGHSVQETKIAPKTLSPEWDETFIFMLEPDQVIALRDCAR
jgi:Ca2+-dependent lipid-binding protein